MPSGNAIGDVTSFLLALAWTVPRILGVFVVLPIFPRSVLPGMLRLCVAAGFGLVVAPSLIPMVKSAGLDATQIALLVVKEAFVGFVLGCLIAVPFWAFEAVGFLVDNQRGASISSTLNPLTGNDSSPLGILFNQAFIVFFFISGGFLLMLEVLYESFRLWDVFTWFPHFRAESVPVLIHQILRLVELSLLLSAPMIVAMFLAEMGLALVSRFVPQLQVFFLAMPIKSALAFLVLILYFSTILDYSRDLVSETPGALRLLEEHWRAPAPEGR
jgi:type III secretion protein T